MNLRLIGGVMLLCLLLAACGAKEAPEHFSFWAGETEVRLDAPAEPILDALGAPESSGGTPSCAFPGMEMTYVYPGFCLRTYPGTDGERVLGFWFTDESRETPEGIRIGSTQQEAEQVYGAGENGRLVLRRGEEKLTLLFIDGRVSSIQYSIL